MKRRRNMVKSDASSDTPSMSGETDAGKTLQMVSKSLDAQTVPKKMASLLQQKTAVTAPNHRPPQLEPRPQQQQPQKQRLSLPVSSMTTSNATSKPTLSSISNSVASLLANPNVIHKSLTPQQPSHIPMSSTCGACGTTVPVSIKSMKQHPKLNIVVCASCYRFYHSGKWKRDADGHFIHCQCCADGGSMVCCSRCDQVACRSCLKRILGRRELAAALDKDWLCLVCHPHQMSAFLSASLRALGALRQKAAAQTRLSFSPQHPKPLNGASPSSSASASTPPLTSASASRMTFGGFKPPATINAFLPAQNRSQSASASTMARPTTPLGGSGRTTNHLVTTTKNLADDFMCDSWNDGEAAAAAASTKARGNTMQLDDDDVVILDSSPALPKASPVHKTGPAIPKPSPKHLNGQPPSFPAANINRNVNFNRSNFTNITNSNINKSNINNNNNNVQSRKTIEQGVNYLDQRLKNWRTLLDKMVRNHSINNNGPVKGKIPLSPRSLRPPHSLRQDFTAMISKMKKEIESLERNLLTTANSSVNVVNVTSDSFKPPAGHHLQRGSPDLHGCWMLPQENKSSPKTRVVQNEDSDLDDDSDEEEEKAVIRIGSGFQAIIPDKRQPSTNAKVGSDEERAEDMLLWHPYGLSEPKTEEFLDKAAISAKGDLQLRITSSFLRDDEKALYLLMKSEFDGELAMKSLERQQKQLQQPQQQHQQHLTKRQRLADNNENVSDDSTTDAKLPAPSSPKASESPSAISSSKPAVGSSSSAKTSVSASPGGQSLITRFLSTKDAGPSKTSTSGAGAKPEQDGVLGIVGRKPIHDISSRSSTSSIIPLDGVIVDESVEAEDVEAEDVEAGSRPSTPSTRSTVSSPQKYVASLNIINGVVQTLDPRPGSDDDDLDVESAGLIPLVETAQVRRWTEAECYAFECGLRAHGKDFNDICKHRLPGRSVAEIVQFYYLWKKTERRNLCDL